MNDFTGLTGKDFPPIIKNLNPLKMDDAELLLRHALESDTVTPQFATALRTLLARKQILEDALRAVHESISKLGKIL